MNKKIRFYGTWVGILGAIFLLIGLGSQYTNKRNTPIQKVSQEIAIDPMPELDPILEVPMFLGSHQTVVPVISNIETMERVALIRGSSVKRIGEILELKKINRYREATNDSTGEEERLSVTTDKRNPENLPDDLEGVYLEPQIFKAFMIEYLHENNEMKVGYVEPEFLVNTKEEVVQEKVAFVRTPSHIYSEEKETLLQLANKGTRLDILGYNDFDPTTGEVKWYKVRLHDDLIEGFIRSKYLVSHEEEANLLFHENNIMDIHEKRGNVLNAGAAKDLDFFPRDKGEFENNKMPREVNALYINSGSIKNAQGYIEVAEGTRINAFVVDIKDNGTPAYPADAMKIYSPTNYEKAQQYFNTEEEYGAGIQKLKDAGFYLIGRITVFKDEYYVRDHPAHAITNTHTNTPYLHNNTYWPSPFIRDVWKFNVELAKESVQKFGFHEIQFDYIRFPDRTLQAERNGSIDFKNVYSETKSQAIQRFAMYAVDELHDMNVYVSGDVFGESAHEYVTAYGQYWGALSNVFDVISPMAYPDHFSSGDYGFDYPWLYPYKLIHFWSKMAVTRQTEIPTPAIIRPWIQSHDATRYPPYPYGANEISEQLKGYYDSGINKGFMTWWSSSSIQGYRSEREAYKKEYE
jgi:hypothetical protein